MWLPVLWWNAGVGDIWKYSTLIQHYHVRHLDFMSYCITE